MHAKNALQQYRLAMDTGEWNSHSSTEIKGNSAKTAGHIDNAPYDRLEPNGVLL
jgi:hypothetical protein